MTFLKKTKMHRCWTLQTGYFATWETMCLKYLFLSQFYIQKVDSLCHFPCASKVKKKQTLFNETKAHQSFFPSWPLAATISCWSLCCLCQLLLFLMANRTMSTINTQDRAYIATPPHLMKNLGLGEISSQYSIVPPTKIRITTNSSTNRTSTASPSHVL